MSNLLKKLAIIKREIPKLQRNKKMIIQKADPNRGKKEFGVWYCTEDLLRDTVEPILALHGIDMAVHGGPASGTEHKEEFAFSARFTFSDIETGESRTYDHPAGGAIGAGMTTATRLFLERFFNVKSYDPGGTYSTTETTTPKGGKEEGGKGKTSLGDRIQFVRDNVHYFSNKVELLAGLDKARGKEEDNQNKVGFIRAACVAINPEDPFAVLKGISSTHGEASPNMEHLKKRNPKDIWFTFLNALDAISENIRQEQNKNQ